MLRIEAGQTEQYCDGMSRRSFVQLGVAGHGLGRPAAAFAGQAGSADIGHAKKNTSVILIWLDGGPGHMDMYDMKPDAPAEYRGLWKPIRTNVPGMDITELFPQQAKVTDKFSIVRSLHHDSGDHFAGGHRMLTTKDRASAAPNNMPASSPASGPSSTATRPAQARACPATSPSPTACRSACGRATSAATSSARSTTRSRRTTTRTRRTSSVNNLDLAAGLTMNRLEDRRGLLEALRPARRDIDSLAADRRRWTASAHQAFDLVGGATPARRSTSDREDAEAPRPLRPQQRRARACSWPGGSSRPARRSSPSTSAAGTTTGT